MKVTVCEMNDDPQAFAADWEKLCRHVQFEASQLVLLPEMPFYPWVARSRRFDEKKWEASVEAHRQWLQRMDELAPAVVLGSRPVSEGTRRLNEGFLWDPQAGYQAVHTKYYLPDDEGFWEASWYQRGDGRFVPIEIVQARIGFAICTELWFMEHARAYGKSGVHLIATPRATLKETVEKWLVGGRASAVISGAFSISSNKTSPAGSWPVFGGRGWIAGPEGQVLGLTSPEQQFVTVDIDLREADLAKQTYPRYVAE